LAVGVGRPRRGAGGPAIRASPFVVYDSGVGSHRGAHRRAVSAGSAGVDGTEVAVFRRLLLPGAVACLGVTGAVQAQAPDVSGRECAPTRGALAVQQVLATNLVVNRFDALVLDQPWARTGFESWARNVRLGWEWDENGFGTNMFAHPFHGALYFTAGRANCLTYFESVPLVFLGSWVWEFFGETHRPALNDFFMTSFGGIALGEMLHRVAATVRDTEAQGAGRIWREIAALMINPMAGLNRLFRGEWTRVGANPSAHDPGAFFFRLNAGARRVHEDSAGITNLAPTVLLDVNYGDPFDRPYREPFDVFSVRVQVTPGGGGLNALQTAGRIFQTALPSWGPGIRHALVVSHRYDYIDNPVYSFGGQSVEVGVVSRFSLSGGFTLRSKVAGDLVVLGAIDAPLGGVGERTYDFGSGGGGRLELALERHGKTYLAFYNRAEYLHSVSGAPANHLVLFSGLEGNVPLPHGFGVGFYLSGDSRESRYTGSPDNTRQFLETRIFVSWTGARRPAAGQAP
jgi:hypothetical protein